jgi:hypothetical protein
VAAPAPLAFLPDLFEEHVDELGFLRLQRRTAVDDPERTWRSLCDLDGRLEAHVAGVLAIGPHMPPRLRPALGGPDPRRAFAAALALVRARDVDGTRTLLDLLPTVEPDIFDALVDALAMAAPTALVAHLVPLVRTDDLPRAAPLLEAIVRRGGTLPERPPIEALLAHDAPAVRVTGWRLAAHRGTAVADPTVERGLADADPAVRRAAVDAAIWLRTPWLLDAARTAAARPTPEALPLLGALALLGPAEDHGRIAHAAATASLGPDRFDLARQVGTPDMVERCIAAMTPDDPTAAAAAGLAFQRITGESVRGTTRVALVPPGADAFAAAFADEVMLPDPVEARRRWTRIRRGVADGAPLAHGIPVDAPVDRETLGRFDVIARRERYQRARWLGLWGDSPFTLDAFPQR